MVGGSVLGTPASSTTKAGRHDIGDYCFRKAGIILLPGMYFNENSNPLHLTKPD
jgi:hypothetical protein